MVDKVQTLINQIPSQRVKRGIQAIASLLLNDDTTHKAIIFGAAATPISIAGAFTTGIEISADGTTGISITSGFSGVTGISFAGTATDGILVSGICGDGVHISGANTVSGLHISGDQATAILVDVDAALATGLSFAVDTGITMTTGILMTNTGTGTITTAISLIYTNSATEGIAMTMATAEVMATGMSMSGAGTYTKGILLDATAITTAIEISAGSMTDAILISGATPADGIQISSVCSGSAINLSGAGATGITIAAQTVMGIALAVAAGVGGISIDAGTVNHAADGSIVTVNLDVEGAYSVNAYNVTMDFETTGMGAADVCAAFKADINELLVHTNGAGLHGTDITITGFATGLADLVGHLVTLDGTKTTGDTATGFKVIDTQTINHSGAILYGNWIDFSGMTLTDGTVYGTYIDVSFVNGSTAYGLYINGGTALTAGISLNGINTIGLEIAATCTTGIHISGPVTTGILFDDVVTQRALDIQITPTTADRQLYMVIDYALTGTKEAAYIIAKAANNTGEVIGIRGRAEQHHASASGGEARGVYGQGVSAEALWGGTVTGVFGNAIAKTTSTVTTLRGGFFEAESEGTPTAITNIYGIHTRCKTTVAPGTDFILGLWETEKMGAGVALDSFQAFKTTTWAAGETVATYVIDMNALVGTVTSIINLGAVTATNLLEADADGDGACTIAGGTYSTADGYFTVLIDGNTYRMPFYAAVD
jgi:hypothetical protein